MSDKPDYSQEFFGLQTKRVTTEVPVGKDFRAVAIPDTHLPFAKEERINEVLKFVKDFKPTHVVQLGDLYDNYSFSSYVKSVDFVTPEKEIREARKMAIDLWDKINKLSPKSEKYQLWGNHDQRIIRRLYEKAPEFASLFKDPVQSLYHFNNVTDVGPYGSELKIRIRTDDVQEYQDIYLLHGVYVGPKSHMTRYGDSVIRAHSHKASINYQGYCSGKKVFELDAGCVVDKDKLAFKYAKTFDPGWVPGFGYVEKKRGLLNSHFEQLP